MQPADSEPDGEEAQFTLDDRIGFVGAGASECTLDVMVMYIICPGFRISCFSWPQAMLACGGRPSAAAAARSIAMTGHWMLSCCIAAVGEALIRGFCEAGISSADRLSASVRSSERQKKMTSLGVRMFGDATRGGAEELAANR